MARPRVVDTGDGLQIWRVAENMLGWPRGLTTPHRKSQYVLRNTTHTLGPGRIICSGQGPLAGSRISSGSIVSDYGLDDWAIGVRFPAGAEDFSSIICVQTGYGAHPASCTMGTGDPFPSGKARPGRDADDSPPSSAEVVNE
jgi:hypothetical protein